MSEAPVTLRYRKAATSLGQPITLRYQAVKEEGTVVAGTLVGDGYRIEGAPLGFGGGEGEVYRAGRGEKQGAFAIKVYFPQVQPDLRVMEELRGLAHPNIVRVLDHGDWQGRFYEVMEYCPGGSLEDVMPLNEYQLRDYLAQILAGLEYCHRRGIVHRDIKPANLFFADRERRRVCLGDFGISVHIGSQGDPAGLAGLTPDYIAPELLDGSRMSPKSDYYALGISLIHLLLGASPFSKLSPGEIFAAHLRARVPLPETLSEAMGLLIRGLTQFEPERRWGYREAMGFLHGDVAAITPDVHHRRASRPYPGYPQAVDAAGLAAALDRFDAAGQLARGDIRRWVFDCVDAELAERVAELEPLVGRRTEEALVRLRYLLDPFQPLQLGERGIRHLAELVQVLAHSPELVRRAYRTGALIYWIEGGRLAGERSDELVERIRGIQERLAAEPEAALRVLLHTLDPQRPLCLGKHLTLEHPGQLGELYRKARRPLLEALQEALFSRLLEEWLRATELTDWQRHADFVQATREAYVERPRQGAYAVLWHFVPELPLPFAGEAIQDPQRLARLIDSDRRHWQQGRRMLEDGWLRTWLVATGRVPSITDLDHLVLALDMSWDAKLEALLQVLEPEIGSPVMAVSPHLLAFSSMQPDQRRIRQLEISNTGRGHLYGRILLEEYGQGITLNDFAIEGPVCAVEVTLDTLGLAPGQYHNQLRLLTNAGEQSVDISFYVREPPEKSWWESLTE